MDYYISVACIAVASILSSVISLPILKILQLSGYKSKGVIAWWKGTAYDTFIRYAALMLFGFIAMIVYVGCFGAFMFARYSAVALYILLLVVFVVLAHKSKSDNVKFTGRIKRLFALDMILTLVLGAGSAWAAYYSPYCQTVVAALGFFAPFVAMLCNIFMSPVEKLNNGKYVRRAKAKLADKAPIVIGITGSYGKTTAKNLLRAMLSEAAPTLATPGSYNTPMGVCKTINNDLGDEKYLIAELGARYVGDIAELCGIVAPKYGIITAIGDMHIETLKSREGVANAKFELGKALPKDGLLALNGYNDDCALLYERDTACAKTLVGIEQDIRYEDLRIDGSGTSFKLYLRGSEYSVTTKLLGAHIAELVCVCAAVAIECGVTAESIVRAVESVGQVEHRLQLVPSPDPNIVVIDDAYNSNPVGAKNALDVLNCFDAKKIVITPGFVELGAIEKSCNTALGKDIAAVCDYAFLVGSRADDIKSGAVSNGMNEGSISVFASRDEAVAALKDIVGSKAVLFENDLPDNIK